MPVLPAVPSTIRPPGRNSPVASASRMMNSAARSFTDCPGFMNSALARISHLVCSLARRSRIRGVFPMASRTLLATCMSRYLGGDLGFGEIELHHVGPFGPEPGLAIAQVEAPELAEPLVEAEVLDLLPGCIEALRP